MALYTCAPSSVSKEDVSSDIESDLLQLYVLVQDSAEEAIDMCRERDIKCYKITLVIEEVTTQSDEETANTSTPLPTLFTPDQLP